LDSERIKEAEEYETFPPPVYRQISDMPFYSLIARRK
jgi:hypothetical protein